MNIDDILKQFGAVEGASSITSNHVYAVAYIRVSTERQEEMGSSLPAQHSEIEKYAEKNGIEIVHFYEEAKSGFHEEHLRIEFLKMMEFAKSDSRVCMVLVHDSSRFCRDAYRAPQLTGELLQHGVRVVSVTEPSYDPETSLGIWMQKMTEAKNASYSMEVAFHTKKGMKQNIQGRDVDTGYCYQNGGQPIFGYKAKRVTIGVQRNGESILKTIWIYNDEIVHGRPMHEWAREMLAMAANGASLDRIRNFLNDSGVPAPRKNYWGTSTIHGLLELSCLMQYSGYAVWNVRGKKQRRNPVEQWIIVPDGMPAIISKEEAAKIYQVRKRYAGLALSERNSAARTDSSRYLLSGGLFKCKRCNSNLVGFVGMNGKHYRKEYYRCGSSYYRRGLGCGAAKYVGREDIENLIINTIGQLLEQWAAPELFVKQVAKQVPISANDQVIQRAAVNKQLLETDRKQAKIYAAIEDGLEDVKWANDRLRELSTEKIELEARLNKISQMEADMRLDVTAIKDAFKQFAEVIAYGTNAEKRSLIRAFVSRIEIEPESGTITVLFRGFPDNFVIQIGAYSCVSSLSTTLQTT